MSALNKTEKMYQHVGLPQGVEVWTLESHIDNRGTLTEIFRAEWSDHPQPKQWNFVHSHANTLRGLHVHIVHHDYYGLLQGTQTLVMKDLRTHSSTSQRVSVLTFNAEEGIHITYIPPGVAHAFLAHTPTLTIVGASEYYDIADELGCHWQDPALDITWPCTDPIVSERDNQAPSFKTLLAQIEAWENSVIA